MTPAPVDPEAASLHARVRLLEAQTQQAAQLLAAVVALVPAVAELVQVLSRSTPHPWIDPLGSIHRDVKDKQQPLEIENSSSYKTAAVESRSIHPSLLDRSTPWIRPESQRRQDARRLARAGWTHIGQRRWRGPEGQEAASRQQALAQLPKPEQLHLPVLVPVVLPPAQQRAAHAAGAAASGPPGALSRVGELAGLWNEVLAGLSHPWGAVLKGHQEALESVARADGRWRTLAEWRRILWRVRASPFLQGQRPFAGGRLIVMRPPLLLSSSPERGTFASRVEAGQYDPEPEVANLRDANSGHPVKKRLTVDAQGLSWYPGRCLIGCCLSGCELEALTGAAAGDGSLEPEGALCWGHSKAFEAWLREEQVLSPEEASERVHRVAQWRERGALSRAVGSL